MVEYYRKKEQIRVRNAIIANSVVRLGLTEKETLNKADVRRSLADLLGMKKKKNPLGPSVHAHVSSSHSSAR